jgi:hypothetical protein
VTTFEELKAKLSELVAIAKELPDGPGRTSVLQLIDGIRSTVDSVVTRRQPPDAESQS